MAQHARPFYQVKLRAPITLSAKPGSFVDGIKISDDRVILNWPDHKSEGRGVSPHKIVLTNQEYLYN